MQISFYAQSLAYSGANSFDISSPTHIGEYVIPRQETRPTGMIYGDSGNKFYMLGSDRDYVVQYSLSTPYDITTKSVIESSFRVKNEEGNPQDVIFNTAGTRMYILGGAGDDVTEYVVNTAWDLSSIDTVMDVPVIFNAEAAIDAYLGPNNHGDDLTGFRFNTNGTKLFIVDRSSDKVFEFSLTAYDLSTASLDRDIDIAGEENNARAIEFNDDGKELYIIGHQSDAINTYNLSTGYDLSTLGTKTVTAALTEGEPNALLINNDGTKVYVAGFIDQEIKHYTLTPGYDFTSISLDDSSIFVTLFESNPQGMVFNNDGTKLFVAGATSDSILEINLSTPYDIGTGSLENVLSITNEETTPLGLAFNSDGSTLFVIGNDDDGINQYALSSNFDLSSTVTHSGPFSVDITETNNEQSPRDMVFNGDGSKLFVLGNRRDRVFQFSLSSNYDLTTLAADYDGNYNVKPVDNSPQGLAFNSDGSKFYIAGKQGGDINEFTLTNNFDVTTGTITNTNTYSIATEESAILDIVFNGDGSKFYICGNNGDDMNQYYTKLLLPETPNDGTIDDTTNPVIITLTGDTFFASSGVFSASEVTISNVPEGLTAVLTLNSNTEAQLSFTGKANSHLNSDEATANLEFTFLDAAFTTSNAADVLYAVAKTNVTGFDYIECADNEIVYNSGWTGGNNAGEPDDSAADLLLGIRTQGDITITANTNCDCLHVESGQTLTIADGVNLTVTNALELDGDLRLLGTSQLIQTHSGVKNASGKGKLYKDVTGTLVNVYQSGYWTSPVTTDGLTYNIAGVLKDGSTALTASNTPLDIAFSGAFDGDNSISPISLSRKWLAKLTNAGDWTREISETLAINPTEGFNKKSTGNASGQNYTFVGRPNDGEYTSDITTGNYSLLGNPYPSPIDIDIFTSENSTAITGTIYFYEAGIDVDHYRATYVGGYATRVASMGNSTSSLGDGTGTKIPGQFVGIGQGFFVEASGTGGTITFNNNTQRALNTPNVFFSKKQSKIETTSFPILRIGFEFLYNEEIYHRPVSVGFRGLTNQFDAGYEAEMWDYNPTDMALKIKGNNLPYAITGINDFNTNLVIPLKVKSDVNRDVTFKIDEIINIDSNVFLYDSFTQNYYNIISENAIITLNSGVYDDRFYITFNEKILGVDNYELNEITIRNNNNELIISSENLIDEVFIYNLLGQSIITKNNYFKKSKININTTHFKKGIYVIKAKNSKGSFSQKISIN
ncbi:MAG: beta-propeller fold lactonase family protein [Polaribacter sp.]